METPHYFMDYLFFLSRSNYGYNKSLAQPLKKERISWENWSNLHLEGYLTYLQKYALAKLIL